MKRFKLICLVTALAASVTVSANAQQATQSEIVDALKPKSSVKTRSLTAKPGLSDAEQAVIDAARRTTRGISAVEREKIDKIVEAKQLPSIDLEIFFDYNSADISAAAKPDLIELGLALRNDALKDAVFLIAGHTDAAGSYSYNQQLSDLRANSVKVFLVETFSIPVDSLIAVGYGEAKLKNSSEPDSGVNRRVNIVNLSN
jgi:outer membrane protein OmpA-like peptidoglycan-associated protein